MPFPDKEVPLDFLNVAKELIKRPAVTEREFIDLCLLAVALIDGGDTTMLGRNNMSLYIANLWVRHRNIGDISLLSEIGGQFGEWEIPGYFGLKDEIDKRQWQKLKSWIEEADKIYQK